MEAISFSKQVKKEICQREFRNSCCVSAACYGVACVGKYFDVNGVVLHTENAFIARWVQELYRLADIAGKVYVKGKAPARIYEFSVKDHYEVEKMLALFGHTGEETSVSIHPDNFMCEHCFSAFVAAGFICCGTTTDPGKGYNLEFVSNRYKMLQGLEKLLQERGFSPKRAVRNGINVLYFKASSQVEDMLTFIGAQKATLEVMSSKVLKDFRNRANRIANCETANIDKTVAATAQAREDIRLLRQYGILGNLSEVLQEAAYLREENPELSLSELASMCTQPVSKSGLSHRYRKLAQLAQQYKE